MSSSGLRELSEDGTTTEQYEYKYNSDDRQYCIGDFEDGDFRMKLRHSRFYVAVREFCRS
jgi:rRNA pseudouridine-1189 N-methylase Emg1 (Nep1/Mra1 family)